MIASAATFFGQESCCPLCVELYQYINVRNIMRSSMCQCVYMYIFITMTTCFTNEEPQLTICCNHQSFCSKRAAHVDICDLYMYMSVNMVCIKDVLMSTEYVLVHTYPNIQCIHVHVHVHVHGTLYVHCIYSFIMYMVHCMYSFIM